MLQFLRKKDNLWLLGLCNVIMFLATIQFSTNLLYSVDDYYNLSEYSINWGSLGYNFWTYGRYIQGFIFELLDYINLSPLIKPTGMYCFIFFNTVLGIHHFTTL